MYTNTSIRPNVFATKSVTRKRTVATGARMSSNTPPSKTDTTKMIRRPSLSDRLSFAERLNGRLAMVGFVSGTGCELIKHITYTDQLQTTTPAVIALSVMIAYASFITRDNAVVEKKPFTTDLEVLNGRLAMMGLLAKFVYENSVVLM